MNLAATTSVKPKLDQKSVLRERARKGPDLVWKMLVVLWMIALGSEYFDKVPYPLTEQFSLPFPRFMLVSLLMFAIFIIWILGNRVHLNVSAIFRPLLVFWVVSQISIIGLIWMGAGSSEVLQFIKTDLHFTVYTAFVYVILSLANWNRIRLLLRLYYCLGIAAAIIAIMQFVHGNFGWLPWMSNYLFQSGVYRDVGFRASSVFGEPSWAARYYVHWIALSIAFYAWSRKARYIVFLVLFGVAFYMAASLAGYLVLGAFLVFLLIQVRGKLLPISHQAKVLAFLTGGLLVCMLLLVVMFSSGVPVPPLLKTSMQRVGQVFQGGGGVGIRLDASQAGLQLWTDSPVFGVGLGNARFYLPDFFTLDQSFKSFIGTDSAHVQILAETGLIGFVAFLYFMVRAIRTPRGNAYRVPESRDRDKAYLLLRFLQIDLAAQVVGMVFYADYLSPQMWTFVGMILALQKIVSERRNTITAAEGVQNKNLNPNSEP